MTIPLIDLQAQYRGIKPEIDGAIERVLASGQFVLGPEVAALEQEIASYCGTRHAVAVASGTDALELSLRAAGIGPGDEVLTSALGFFAVAEAILAVGAVPVFGDIEPRTFGLDPDDAARRITPKTKALLPVHLYGHPCAMEPLLELARARRLRVIEDCAQAIGATSQGRRVGSLGDAGCLSFYPTKNLGAYGDAGMVVTNDAALAQQVRLLRTHGQRERYRHVALGRNSRLDEIQAAILRVKLRHLDAWTDARRRWAQAYATAITQRALPGVQLPQEQPGNRHVYYLYCVRLPNRDRVVDALTGAGIGTQIAYPSSLPHQPALERVVRRQVYPVAEAVCRDILALPMYPELDQPAVQRVTDELAAALGAA